MRYILGLSLLVILAACSNSNGTPEPDPPINTNPVHLPRSPGGPVQLAALFDAGDCHVKVELISTGGGVFMTDTSAPGTDFMIFDHQMTSPLVGDFYQQFWGREGEWSSCAQVPNPNNIPVLVAELNTILNTNGQISPGQIQITP